MGQVLCNCLSYCYSLTSVTIGTSLETLDDLALAYCPKLVCVKLENNIKNFGQTIFGNCPNLEKVLYNGTIEEWNAITKASGWNSGVPSTTIVICKDGTLSLA